MFEPLKRVLSHFNVLLFGIGIFVLVETWYRLPSSFKETETWSVALFVLLVAAFVSWFPARQRLNHYWIYTLFLLALLITVPFAFMERAFRTKSVGALIVSLSENSVEDLKAFGTDGFSKEIFEFCVLAIILMITSFFLLRTKRFAPPVLIGLSCFSILFGPIAAHIKYQLVGNKYHDILNDETIGVSVLSPNQGSKKNLVLIYMESIERTYRNIELTKGPFQKLSQYEDEGISARNIMEIDGTDFTAGGLMATQCGVPMISKGVFNLRRKLRSRMNLDMKTDAIMPSLTCLGDILSDDGYIGSYINGSDLEVFSKGKIFSDHGYERVVGLKSIPDWETHPRTNVWGMNDDLMFELVHKELEYLKDQDKPFLLSMLTIATHGPNAFLDHSCAEPKLEETNLPDAISCTAEHIESVIQKIDALGLSEDTIIVILSDHLAMRNTLTDQLDKDLEKRRNYLTILNADAPKILMKSASTLDVYPTLLEVMGYEISEGRANFGRSLFRSEPTLVEQHGVDAINRAISANSDLQKRLWASSN